MKYPIPMLSFDFSVFPELTTERLLLRRITRDDVGPIFNLRSNPSLMQYVSRPVAESEQDALDLIARIDDGIQSNLTINWGIALKGDDTVIGVAGFVRSTPEHHRAELGYLLSDQFHRKGIMNEALRAILVYGFRQMKLHQAEAVTDPRNTASAGVLEKLGFIRDGHFRESYLYNGEFLDSVHFSLLAKNFKS